MLRRTALACIALIGLASTATAQIAYTQDTMLTRTALGRLGLEKNWSTVVPLGPSDDRLLDVSISGGILFAQTGGGMLHAYDAETGRYLWNSGIQRGLDIAFPVAVGGKTVLVTAGKSLIGLDKLTGRPVWKEQLDGIAATGVVADEEYAIVGEQNGKLVAYNLKDRSKDDPPGRSPGTFAWAMQTNDTLTSRPLVTPKLLALGSHDHRVYTTVLPEPGSGKVEPLYRFLTDGPVSAPLVGMGSRTLIVPSEDKKLYGIDLFSGTPKWTVATGDPINRAPFVIGETAYAINSSGRLIAIDGKSGTILWDRPTEASDIVSVSPSRLYLMTSYRDMSIVDRATGQMLATPRDSHERAELHSRNYTLNIVNEENDRIYLASPNGLVYSLREMGHLQPAPLRDPSLPPFGYIPPEGLPDEKPAPLIAPTPPAEVTPDTTPTGKPADNEPAEPVADDDEEEL